VGYLALMENKERQEIAYQLREKLESSKTTEEEKSRERRKYMDNSGTAGRMEPEGIQTSLNQRFSYRRESRVIVRGDPIASLERGEGNEEKY
jgi:hypothetical protein